MRPLGAELEARALLGGEYPGVALRSDRKKRRYAYLAWLCLGSHYLYLRRPVVQLLFWLTAGGLLIWWLIDLFRLPEMVQRYNRRALERLIDRYHTLLEQRVSRLEVLEPRPFRPGAGAALSAGPTPVPTLSEAEELHAYDEPHLPPLHHEPNSDPEPVRRLSPRRAPALILLSTLLIAVALYIFNPPPLYPRSAAGEAFETTRQVNVRTMATTASAIEGVLAEGAIVRGRVEGAASGGARRWLRIGQGAHEGKYVAIENLKAQ